MAHVESPMGLLRRTAQERVTKLAQARKDEARYRERLTVKYGAAPDRTVANARVDAYERSAREFAQTVEAFDALADTEVADTLDLLAGAVLVRVWDDHDNFREVRLTGEQRKLFMALAGIGGSK